jgi:8-oxo-dGTP pyrophosphatase MutT (NUDIX family)
MLDKCPFNDSLTSRIASNLSAFEARQQDRLGKKHAAVAFTLIRCSEPADIGNIPFKDGDSEEAGFVLTTRAAKLSSHAGQRAFPGGRIDSGETVEQAALRELEEEVGLKLDRDAILGYLDDYTTRSGFVISPVVVWAGNNNSLLANPGEVECIHRIPLTELLRDDAPILEDIAESSEPVIKMPLGDDWFAAPTAAIAFQFREVALLGRSTRVAHFDQPLFAWK